MVGKICAQPAHYYFVRIQHLANEFLSGAYVMLTMLQFVVFPPCSAVNGHTYEIEITLLYKMQNLDIKVSPDCGSTSLLR